MAIDSRGHLRRSEQSPHALDSSVEADREQQRGLTQGGDDLNAPQAPCASFTDRSVHHRCCDERNRQTNRICRGVRCISQKGKTSRNHRPDQLGNHDDPCKSKRYSQPDAQRRITGCRVGRSVVVSGSHFSRSPFDPHSDGLRAPECINICACDYMSGWVGM